MKEKLLTVFKTKEGEIVIGQKPNLPLILAIIFYILRFVELRLFSLSEIGFILFLGIWSLWEIAEGVNLWRRFLGVLVFVSMLIRLVY